MWLAYMDEAGNTGRNLADPNQPQHLIVSLLVPEQNISTIHALMRAIAQQYFPTTWSNDDFEFHGAHIFGRGGMFETWAAAPRIALYGQILQVVAATGARVIVRGVDKPRLAVRYPAPFHPHDIVLM